MDFRERIGDAEEAVRIGFETMRSVLWTALPGIIQAYDATRLTCAVQPTIKANVQAADGSISQMALPVLLDCPVQFAGGGGVTLTLPLKAGDECLVILASRCIDSWWQLGGVQGQAESRMHSLSDGFVIPGVRSLPRALASVSTATAQLRSDDGLTYIDFDPAGQIVKIVAPGGVTITTPTLTVNGQIVASGNVTGQGTSLHTHVHGGVQPGASNTGAPV